MAPKATCGHKLRMHGINLRYTCLSRNTPYDCERGPSPAVSHRSAPLSAQVRATLLNGHHAHCPVLARGQVDHQRLTGTQPRVTRWHLGP